MIVYTSQSSTVPWSFSISTCSLADICEVRGLKFQIVLGVVVFVLVQLGFFGMALFLLRAVLVDALGVRRAVTISWWSFY